MSLFTRPLYKLQHIFLQIFGLFSTNLPKTLPKTALFCVFLDGFRPNNKQKTQKFSRASRAESLLYFYKFAHKFLQISAPFSTNSSTIFYKLHFSTNFSMAFYKLHFSTNCIFKPRILLQMSLFSSTNVIFQKRLSTNFTNIFYNFFYKFRGGGKLPVSLWYTFSL